MIEIVKYLIEGLAVSVASHLVSRGTLDVREIVLLGISAALIFMVLETFSPSIAVGARQGAGFGIGYNMVREGFDDGAEGEEYASPLQAEIVTGSGNSPYKMVDGIYSAKVLLAGYNENAKAYNDDRNRQYEKWPWGLEQAGGYYNEEESHAMPAPESMPHPTTMPAPTTASTTASTTMPAASESMPRPTTMPAPITMPVTSEGMPTSAAMTSTDMSKKNNPDIIRDGDYRSADVLYSGDIVDILAGAKFMQRGTIDSQIIFDDPLPKVGTNLSKVRIMSPKHRGSRQTPLNYGETVYIMHNAYFNNTNQNKFIKYGDRLQSHQEGPLFRAFKIYDASNKDLKGAVQLSRPVVLARGDQQGTNIYIKVEADKSVSSKNPLSEATQLTLSLRRVYERNNRNLCVCPSEVLYP